MAESGDQDNNVIALQIPEGTETGDVLTFVVNGQSLELAVPPGSQPGDVLEIQLGDTTKNVGGESHNHDDTSKEASSIKGETDDGTRTTDSCIKHSSNNNNNVVSIPLITVPGQVLKLATSLPIEKKNDKSDNNNSNSNSTADTQSDGTNAMAWPAGLEMVRYLQTSKAKEHLHKILCQNSDTNNNDQVGVLELGSGLGLVGMTFATEILGPLREQEESEAAAATSTATPPPFSKVVLTDTDLALPLLHYNVDENIHVIPPNVQITTESCMWGNAAPVSANKKYDWIIGSDLLYNVSSIPNLVSTIQDSLNPHHGRILLGVRWRKPKEEREFFELLSQGSNDLKMEWKLLQSPKGCHNIEWQHYGNPQSKDWTHYSNTTMIAIRGGPPKSLNMVTEDDIHKMTNDESKAWESAQIQIYMGTAAVAVVDPQKEEEPNERREHTTKRPRLDNQ